MYLGTLDNIPLVSEALFIFHHLFFFYSSYCTITVDLSLSLLILSSASSDMLLNLYSKLFMLLIVLLNFKISI